MKYTINEIINAINDLQNIKKERILDKIELKKNKTTQKADIPSNTLKLIEEAEIAIKSKMQSE